MGDMIDRPSVLDFDGYKPFFESQEACGHEGHSYRLNTDDLSCRFPDVLAYSCNNCGDTRLSSYGLLFLDNFHHDIF